MRSPANITSRVKIAKISHRREPADAARNSGVRGIPTLILFKNGTVEAQKVGAVSKSQLAAFLDSNLDAPGAPVPVPAAGAQVKK